MSTYNFYLKDKGTRGALWGEGTCYMIGVEMKALFDEVCLLQSCPFSTSDFWWDPTSIKETEVLVYFMDSKSKSVIRRVKPNAPLGAGGTTFISSAGNISEVYIGAANNDPDQARALAVLAFHEIMHNLLKMGNSLHGSGGMGLAAGTVYSSSKLTKRNKELMAGVMGKKIKQNTSFL